MFSSRRSVRISKCIASTERASDSLLKVTRTVLDFFLSFSIFPRPQFFEIYVNARFLEYFFPLFVCWKKFCCVSSRQDPPKSRELSDLMRCCGSGFASGLFALKISLKNLTRYFHRCFVSLNLNFFTGDTQDLYNVFVNLRS